MGSHRRYGRNDSLALARIVQGRQEVREVDVASPPCTASEEYAREALEGFDPECRFARDGFELGLHACTRRDGKLVEAGQAGQCFTEQRQQLLEQGQVVAQATDVFDALRRGMS